MLAHSNCNGNCCHYFAITGPCFIGGYLSLYIRWGILMLFHITFLPSLRQMTTDFFLNIRIVVDGTAHLACHLSGTWKIP